MFFDRVLDNFHNQFQYVHGKNYLSIGEQLSAYFRHLGLSKTGQGQNKRKREHDLLLFRVIHRMRTKFCTKKRHLLV